MCTNYTPATPSHLLALDSLDWAGTVPPAWPVETFPGYDAPILLPGAPGRWVLQTGSYGLIPRWCKDQRQAVTVSRKTYNARSETVADKPSYRQPWRERRWAVAPMLDCFEPCWESGRAVRWRIRLLDAPMFGAAGLHESWIDPQTGDERCSFSLLTVNADGHPLMGRMHRPQDEKRMLVLLPPQSWSHWLQSTTEQALLTLKLASQAVLQGEPAPVRLEPQLSFGF